MKPGLTHFDHLTVLSMPLYPLNTPFYCTNTLSAGFDCTQPPMFPGFTTGAPYRGNCHQKMYRSETKPFLLYSFFSLIPICDSLASPRRLEPLAPRPVDAVTTLLMSAGSWGPTNSWKMKNASRPPRNDTDFTRTERVSNLDGRGLWSAIGFREPVVEGDTAGRGWVAQRGGKASGFKGEWEGGGAGLQGEEWE